MSQLCHHLSIFIDDELYAVIIIAWCFVAVDMPNIVSNLIRTAYTGSTTFIGFLPRKCVMLGVGGDLRQRGMPRTRWIDYSMVCTFD